MTTTTRTASDTSATMRTVMSGTIITIFIRPAVPSASGAAPTDTSAMPTEGPERSPNVREAYETPGLR